MTHAGWGIDASSNCVAATTALVPALCVASSLALQARTRASRDEHSAVSAWWAVSLCFVQLCQECDSMPVLSTRVRVGSGVGAGATKAAMTAAGLSMVVEAMAAS